MTARPARHTAIGVLATGALVGCAASPRPTAGGVGEDGSILEPAPPFAVLERLPAGAPLSADEVYPIDPGTIVLEVVAVDAKGLAPGDAIARTVRATDRFGATVAVAEGDTRTEFLHRDDDGTVRMPAVVEHGKQALTRFAPPLVLAGPMLVAGVEQRSEAKMRVLDARRPERVREAGEAIRTIEYVADERIRTPRGEMIAHRIEIRFEADLRLADATTTSTLWVVPGQGVVACEREEQVRVLGFPADRSFVQLVLVPDEERRPESD